MIASDVLDRCSSMLNDVARVRWTEAMLLEFLADAMRQTVLIRPDSNAAISVVLLAAGDTKQSVPFGAVRFLSLVRNMGAGGITPGFPITPTTREAMDSASSSWHTETASAIIDHYLYNADTPEFFFVSPRPAASVYVEMECARDIDDVLTLDDDLPLNSIWMEPLREYVMYRAFSINAASESDRQRAEAHLRQFYLAIGEEGRAKLLFNPYKPTYVAQGGQ